MNAAAVLARAEAAGIALRLEGGAVKMQAARQPPADLLAALRENREEVHHLLSQRAAPPAPHEETPHPGTHDEPERAAIAEYHAEPARPHVRPMPGDPDYPSPYIPTPQSLVESARIRPTAWADPAAIPSPGSLCSCCASKRWWGDPLGWRCSTCHPAPPGLSNTKEMNT